MPKATARVLLRSVLTVLLATACGESGGSDAAPDETSPEDLHRTGDPDGWEEVEQRVLDAVGVEDVAHVEDTMEADDTGSAGTDGTDGWDGGPCVPSCEGKECGTDGCGGPCGECEDPDAQCTVHGVCVPPPTCSEVLVCAAQCGASSSGCLNECSQDAPAAVKPLVQHQPAGDPPSGRPPSSSTCARTSQDKPPSTGCTPTWRRLHRRGPTTTASPPSKSNAARSVHVLEDGAPVEGGVLRRALPTPKLHREHTCRGLRFHCRSFSAGLRRDGRAGHGKYPEERQSRPRPEA